MQWHGVYKGETPSKSITRSFVWLQHGRLLKRRFKSTPHVFLASRIAGDVATLRGMMVPPAHIWAVENQRVEFEKLFDRCEREGFHLYTEKIESVVASNADANIRSVYLDYCGNLDGTAVTTRRVVAQLPAHSVLSVTLFLGRERAKPESRENALLRLIREHTRHQVTVVQSVLYLSTTDDFKVSPMGTWTFYIGPASSQAKMRFDLHEYSCDDLRHLSADAVRVLWQGRLKLAENRSKGAVKANLTRAA